MSAKATERQGSLTVEDRGVGQSPRYRASIRVKGTVLAVEDDSRETALFNLGVKAIDWHHQQQDKPRL